MFYYIKRQTKCLAYYFCYMDNLGVVSHDQRQILKYSCGVQRGCLTFVLVMRSEI